MEVAAGHIPLKVPFFMTKTNISEVICLMLIGHWLENSTLPKEFWEATLKAPAEKNTLLSQFGGSSKNRTR